MENEDLSAFLIPETLDEPEKILFFTYGELGLLMFPALVGILCNYTIRGLIIGVVSFLIYKKIKPSRNGFSITHLMYWYCPEWLFKTDYLLPSHIRIFIG